MRLLNGSLLPLLLSILICCGCSNNKAATRDNSQASSSASTAATSGLSSSDQNFVSDAAKGNRAEVELGQMMETKATNPGVKQFAKQMVQDHSNALNQLQQLAQSKNIPLPQGIPADAQDLKQKLSQESGAKADKEYVTGMVNDHQKDVKEFQDAAQNLNDPDLKNWANQMVPKLQEHLQKIENLDSKVNKAK